ncbi:phospholipase D-like domain-containing protein [Coralloluteibacterium thermophilus]|uniref:Phospholipase D-like domain-containing protein n=1 Tax=Coralloluteibacterium thermophilum TaxID=2707049 RepID=A0ABV9NKR9_9GAMM
MSAGADRRDGRRARLRRGLGLLLALYLASAAWQAWKPLPPGIGEAQPLRASADVRFLADRTWVDAEGRRHSEQVIFDEILALIGQAQRLVVLDMFLFNAFGSAPDEDGRALSSELSEALAARLAEVPTLKAVLITDPVNTVYGGVAAPHLAALEAAGATVIVTDLDRLRAPNPLWSGPWRACCAWLGNDPHGGWLPSPFGPERVTLRSYGHLLNFNANHRKTLVVDAGDDWVGLVASANPHDASRAHGNVALRFSGPAVLDLLDTEHAVAAMSGTELRLPDPLPVDAPIEDVLGARVQVLTEGRIRDALLSMLAAAGAGDRIDVAAFYLSHRGVIAALRDAHARGAAVRVLLDPNRDAFGRTKNGVPNRQVARELHAAGVPVRWCDTHGEQCHAKLVLLRRADGDAELVAGSANFTRRNLDDLNLETSLRVLATEDDPAVADAAAWFEEQWSNTPERRYSLPYPAYADDARLRVLLYRIGEATGLSTF